MRKVLRPGLPKSVFTLLSLLIFVQGCARPVLQTYPAGEKEAEAVLEAFTRFRERSEEICGCCLDAEIDAALAVSGWFREHTGRFTGYLQARKPGYLRVVALNPLGQPWYILVTDGRSFKSLNVFEEKAYIGSVGSGTWKKYAPAGFAPEYSYYWLTGRLQPRNLQVRAVWRDRQQDAFWLQISHVDSATESMVLFDPETRLILRHVLRNGQGEHLADVSYGDYLRPAAGENRNRENGPAVAGASHQTAEEEFCRVPGRITVTSRAGSENLELELDSFLIEPSFTPDDFTLIVPGNFEQFLVR